MAVARHNLLLLPGFLCDQEVWSGEIEALADTAVCTCADYELLDSIPAMAAAALRSAPARFAVAGHSMGGRIALEVYRFAPERVTHLALFNTGAAPRPAGPAGEEEARKRRELLGIARSQGMRAMALRWVQGMVAPHRLADQTLIETIVAMFERKTPEIFEAQMNALLARPDATAMLSKIHCPTLVLTGGEDVWSTPATHEQLSARIPKSRLAIVPGCAHMSLMEKPAAVAQAMREWLEEK
jgi:pimeloyl-ACP methyl ester carboxylesterase